MSFLLTLWCLPLLVLAISICGAARWDDLGSPYKTSFQSPFHQSHFHHLDTKIILRKKKLSSNISFLPQLLLTAYSLHQKDSSSKDVTSQTCISNSPHLNFSIAKRVLFLCYQRIQRRGRLGDATIYTLDKFSEPNSNMGTPSPPQYVLTFSCKREGIFCYQHDHLGCYCR